MGECHYFSALHPLYKRAQRISSSEKWDQKPREVFVKYESLSKICSADRHKIVVFQYCEKVQPLPYQNTKDQEAKIKSEESGCNPLNGEKYNSKCTKKLEKGNIP